MNRWINSHFLNRNETTEMKQKMTNGCCHSLSFCTFWDLSPQEYITQNYHFVVHQACTKSPLKFSLDTIELMFRCWELWCTTVSQRLALLTNRKMNIVGVSSKIQSILHICLCRGHPKGVKYPVLNRLIMYLSRVCISKVSGVQKHSNFVFYTRINQI